MQAACKNNPDDEDALRTIDILYDTALISSGFTVSITQYFYALTKTCTDL